MYNLIEYSNAYSKTTGSLCRKVKHELRVTSSNPGVTVQIHELRVQIHELED